MKVWFKEDGGHAVKRIHLAYAAVGSANEKFGGNVVFARSPEFDGRAVSFTLRVRDSKAPGHRLGIALTSKGNRRRIPAACYHVHLEVMRQLFSLGASRILTGMADYRSAEVLEHNVGSVIAPVAYGVVRVRRRHVGRAVLRRPR